MCVYIVGAYRVRDSHFDRYRVRRSEYSNLDLAADRCARSEWAIEAYRCTRDCETYIIRELLY